MSSTPEDEDMEDEYIIDVQVAPGADLPSVPAAAQKRQPSPTLEDTSDDDEYVILKVRRGAEEEKFRTKKVYLRSLLFQ